MSLKMPKMPLAISTLYSSSARSKQEAAYAAAREALESVWRSAASEHEYPYEMPESLVSAFNDTVKGKGLSTEQVRTLAALTLIKPTIYREADSVPEDERESFPDFPGSYGHGTVFKTMRAFFKEHKLGFEVMETTWEGVGELRRLTNMSIEDQLKHFGTGATSLSAQGESSVSPAPIAWGAIGYSGGAIESDARAVRKFQRSTMWGCAVMEQFPHLVRQKKFQSRIADLERHYLTKTGDVVSDPDAEAPALTDEDKKVLELLSSVYSAHYKVYKDVPLEDPKVVAAYMKWQAERLRAARERPREDTCGDLSRYGATTAGRMGGG